MDSHLDGGERIGNSFVYLNFSPCVELPLTSKATGSGDSMHLSVELWNLFQGNDHFVSSYPPLPVANVICIFPFSISPVSCISATSSSFSL